MKFSEFPNIATKTVEQIEDDLLDKLGDNWSVNNFGSFVFFTIRRLAELEYKLHKLSQALPERYRSNYYE